MDNVAQIADYQETKKILAEKLKAYLRSTNDPRVVGGEMAWEDAEYFQDRDKTPTPSKSLQQALDLQEEYSYVE